MMPANMVLLEKITVGAAGASSVTFSSIPQTGYTDLVVKASLRASVDGDGITMRFNGSTSGYSSRQLFGTGSSANSNTPSQTDFATVGYTTTVTSNTFGNLEVYIPNYTSSNNKSISNDSVQEANQTQAYSNLVASLWSNSAAITSITMGTQSGSFNANSTFYLYGVAKLGTTPAIVPYATGGDTIMTDGTYWYHTFTSSGTFTPQKSLSCDYLVVAGGGGGGAFGGGGAGGLRSTVTATGGGGSLESALSLGTSSYTVTIGAGGAGGTSEAKGTSGNNSVFSSITSTGGGGGSGGGQAGNRDGITGGSGGASTNQSGTVGSGTANQGYAGGGGYTDGVTYTAGGGGGGANAVGGSALTSAGNGGNGVATSISGSSVTYAGGGGGGLNAGAGSAGTGGTGGGGNGAKNGTGTAGTANTGGGGGTNGTTSGQAGGSGIVIVRYAV
jgi:hypothetical protein